MRSKRLSIGLRATLLAIFTVTGFVTITYASTEKVLYSFGTNEGDGGVPYGGLIFDAAANLYGTTSGGGTYNDGTVFELTPKAGGGWTEKVLHSFSGKDGAVPYAGLIFDSVGNLYGTTYEGGAYNDGTVFELTPEAGGGWKEKVLHSFSGKDGVYPTASLIFDAAGNLYGTTSDGGAYYDGTVFELTPKAGGGWTEKVLHSFSGKEGAVPYAGLIFDAAGNLYGTTFMGGTNIKYGTVFELTPKAGGGWKEKVLHSFYSQDGDEPIAGLIFDAAGNLYGMTSSGGINNNYGTVFELTPKAGGGWTEKVVHHFNNYKKGVGPQASLIFDGAGNLYGTTYAGGAFGPGTVFELTPEAGGGWTEKVLHSFNNNGNDGYNPLDSLVFDASGNLYGTTYGGGAYDLGMVFEVKP